MKVVKVLDDYSYPAIANKSVLTENAGKILNELYTMFGDKVFSFVGCGTSGAIINTALMLAEKDNRHSFYLVKKSGENTHRRLVTTPVSFEDDKYPIVIIDDVVNSGKTLEYIQKFLTHQGKINDVVCVAANNLELLDFTETKLPNLKLLITN
jgi:hypoxanthine-guanine phosphoribosyltransferase